MLKGAGIKALLSAAAFMIVVVGTIAAIFVQTPLQVMKRAMRILPWVFQPPSVAARRADQEDGRVEQHRAQARPARPGVRSSSASPTISCARACSWWSTAASRTSIRSILEVDLHVREQSDTRAAKVFEGMGIYSPTLGIIGAVLGLMAVMQNLADPSKLGHGIAAAFVATIYGIGLANLFFLPVANKLKVAIAGPEPSRARW